MEKDKSLQPEARILRHRAEHLVLDKAKTALFPVTTEEIQRLLHEFQVQKIELEKQNEELR